MNIYKRPKLILVLLNVLFLCLVGVWYFQFPRISNVTRNLWAAIVSAGCVAYVFVAQYVIKREERRHGVAYFSSPESKYLKSQFVALFLMAAISGIILVSNLLISITRPLPQTTTNALAGIAICTSLFVLFTNYKRAIMDQITMTKRVDRENRKNEHVDHHHHMGRRNDEQDGVHRQHVGIHIFNNLDDEDDEYAAHSLLFPPDET